MRAERSLRAQGLSMLAAVALIATATVAAAPAAANESPPGTPASVSVLRGDGTLTASWPSIVGASHHHVTYSSDWGRSWSLAALHHVGTSITFGGDNDATYIVGVRAGNSAGWGGWRNSAAVEAYISDPPPGTPVSVSVLRGDGTLTASWPSIVGASHHHVTYSSDWGRSWSLAALHHVGTSITFGGDNDATYIVGVRAGNSAGWGGWRNSAAVEAYISDPPPVSPAEVTIAMNAGSAGVGRGNNRKTESLAVTWSAVSSAAYYQVQCAPVYTVRDDPTAHTIGTWTLCADNVSGTSKTITSSEYLMWYYLGYKARVRGMLSGGTPAGDWTESRIAWPVWRSEATVNHRGDGTLVIEWHRAAVAARFGYKYRAQCSTDRITWTTCADNVANTAVNSDGFVEATVTDLDLATAGTQPVSNTAMYYVMGQAFNDTGASPYTPGGQGPYPVLSTPAKFTRVSATRGDGTITVTVQRPARSWLTSVVMVCQPQGGASGACPGSPFTPDLDESLQSSESFTIETGSANNSKSYTITAQAVNALGSGPVSDAITVAAIS